MPKSYGPHDSWEDGEEARFQGDSDYGAYVANATSTVADEGAVANGQALGHKEIEPATRMAESHILGG